MYSDGCTSRLLFSFNAKSSAHSSENALISFVFLYRNSFHFHYFLLSFIPPASFFLLLNTFMHFVNISRCVAIDVLVENRQFNQCKHFSRIFRFYICHCKVFLANDSTGNWQVRIEAKYAFF